MATDIMAIDTGKETNTINMTCSTTPTGFSSKRVVLNDAPFDQQIENIQSKFDDKFDDPTYYSDDGSKNGNDPNSLIVGG